MDGIRIFCYAAFCETGERCDRLSKGVASCIVARTNSLEGDDNRCPPIQAKWLANQQSCKLFPGRWGGTYLVGRVRPFGGGYWASTAEPRAHGACRASLRLPKEKKYETRVFK